MSGNLGADALRLKMRHLETLIERGGSETMQTELTELKRKHKLMVSKEENITGVLYTWKINDETYHGRTVGPITFGLGVAEAETMVQITLTEARSDSRSVTVDISCRYLRRSMFRLTPGDRARFLEATRKIYLHSTDEGQSLFGDGYVGAQVGRE